jgi:class 3 adenylate cyclase
MEKNAAVLMADLTGYTAMTDVHGGASAALLVNKYMAFVEHALCGDTQIVQRVGDQIVLLADNPHDAIETASKLHSLVLAEHNFLSVHAGIHYGSVYVDKGSLFGSTINVASRIMNIAEQGQILCSSALMDIINPNQYSFKHLGAFSFKNLMNEIVLYQLVTDANRQFFTDPVCRMQIDPEKTSFSFSYKNKKYHFCSDYCLNLFSSNPEAFLS